MEINIIKFYVIRFYNKYIISKYKDFMLKTAFYKNVSKDDLYCNVKYN